FLRQPVAKRLSFHDRHDEEQDAACVTRVVEREDVGMIESRREPNLLKKPLAPERFGEIGAENLDGDIAIVAKIAGQVNGGHAARAELSLEAIATRECCRELC